MPQEKMATYRAIAEFYDDEYADLDMLHEDVGYLLARLPKRSSDVLMLACGTGRAAIPVGQAGHRVVGVDLDPAMLEIATRKRDFVGLADKQLSFVAADLLDIDLKRRFDAAAILFNSFLVFTTLEEQDRVLSNAARHLKPRGRLLIDVFNPDVGRIADDEAMNADVRMFYSHAAQTSVQRVTHVRSTDRPQVRETTFEYTWFDAKNRRRRKTVRFELTYLFPRELTMLLERNGFTIETITGDYDGSPVTVDSPRLIVSARKRSVGRR